MRRSRKKFEDEHEEHIPESWLLPYADVLTLLLALFIVLFAVSEIDKSKYEDIMRVFNSEFQGTEKGVPTTNQPTDQPYPSENIPASTPPETSENEAELDQLHQQLETYIAENKLEDAMTLENTDRGIEISLRDFILFDTGQDLLKSSSYDTLNMISGLLSTVPNQVSIEGHTDNVPIGNAPFRSNWELSAARAASVLHYFASQKVEESRLQFTGFGEFQPIQPNNSEASRQANRRVNIVILRNE